MIGRIRKVLCFQAEGMTGAIGAFAFTTAAFRKEVCGVKLDTGLRGIYPHGDACLFGSSNRSGTQRIFCAIQYIVVVIAMALYQLREVIINMFPNADRLSQIHGRTLHRSCHTKGNALGIGGGVGLGENLDRLVQNRAAVMAGEIEIAVVCQAAGSVRIRNSVIADEQRMAADRIGNLDVKIARVSFLPVTACKSQCNGIASTANRGPDPVGKACAATVKMVCAIICGKEVLFSVEGKPCAGDTVCKAAYCGAEVSVVDHILTKGIVTQNNVNRITVAVGNTKRVQCGAVSKYFAGDHIVIQ